MRRVFVILLLSPFLACYSPQKARQQFSRATVAYPEIPARYCATTYPAKDSLIKGDSIVTYDTLWAAGEVHFDTVYNRTRDTVFITRFLPGQVIRETIRATDTVYQENTAALDLCNIERRAAILAADREHKELVSWKGKAKKRWWIIAGMGLVIALGIFGFLRKKITRPKIL